MSKFFDFLREKLNNAINDNNVFIFEGKYLNAVGFLRGMKDKNTVCEIKSLAKQEGMKYDYTYECYIKKSDPNGNHDNYRKEKDQFLEQLVNWKVNHN